MRFLRSYPKDPFEPRSTRAESEQRGSFMAALVAALAVIALLMTGCGSTTLPALGLVEGTVTLDGAPLPAAFVVFTPDGPGRSSTATTDTAGRYTLTYLRDIAGADVGGHSVRITTATRKRGIKETLPLRYHRRSELRATVQPDVNTIDFSLQSK